MAPTRPVVSKSTTTSVKLKWNPPEYDGHSMTISYLVEQLQEGYDDWRPIVQQTKTSFVVKTLNPNTWYQFRIIASNEHGSSEPSQPSEKVYTTIRNRSKLYFCLIFVNTYTLLQLGHQQLEEKFIQTVSQPKVHWENEEL